MITVSDFEERLNNQSPYVRARYASVEQKKEYLDNLVKFEVLATEARKQGLDRDPEVVRTMKQVMIQKLLKARFDKLKQEDISDADAALLRWAPRRVQSSARDLRQPDPACRRSDGQEGRR